jgi:hypothetical protein
VPVVAPLDEAELAQVVDDARHQPTVAAGERCEPGRGERLGTVVVGDRLQQVEAACRGVLRGRTASHGRMLAVALLATIPNTERTGHQHRVAPGAIDGSEG